jgi:hypothetical protein
MTIAQKWLYVAMALTGGFLGGIAAMEFAPGWPSQRIKLACYVRNSSNWWITAAASGPYSGLLRTEWRTS